MFGFLYADTKHVLLAIAAVILGLCVACNAALFLFGSDWTKVEFLTTTVCPMVHFGLSLHHTAGACVFAFCGGLLR